MGDGGQRKTPARTAGQICEAAELGEAARALLRDQSSPQQYLELLVEKQEFPDAVRFLAHALPKREAVWWAWVCARRAAGADPPPKIKAALEATEKWIAQPNDENRRKAMAGAEQAQFSTPAGSAGLAAFFSGGSLGPPDVPPIPPGEYLTAKAVSGAVIFAAVATEPEKAPEKFQTFIAQGVEVAKRIKLWAETKDSGS